MPADKKALSAKVTIDTDERVEALAEDRGARKSDVIRRALAEYLEQEEGDEDTSPSRSPSPLALLGVVALAIAPTLLATGYTLVGGVAGVVAATYAVLWVTAYDTLVEERLGTARDELREVGGVVGFFRAVIYETRVVDDPETPVERLTYADVGGIVALTAATLLGLPLAAAAYLGVLTPAIEAIGSAGAFAIVVLLVGLAYLGAGLLGLSALATLALASAGVVGTTDTDTDADA